MNTRFFFCTLHLTPRCYTKLKRTNLIRDNIFENIFKYFDRVIDLVSTTLNGSGRGGNVFLQACGHQSLSVTVAAPRRSTPGGGGGGGGGVSRVRHSVLSAVSEPERTNTTTLHASNYTL